MKTSGGSNTTLYGKKFEEKTNAETYLLEHNFIKKMFKKKHYLINENKKICFFKQTSLKPYLLMNYKIDIFRIPDEAYLDEDKKILKILEKKEQSVSGSVETKLWAAPALKREYQLVLQNEFTIEYALCVNSYLQNLFLSDSKKYQILKIILLENNIKLFFGDDDDYLIKLFDWINQ